MSQKMNTLANLDAAEVINFDQYMNDIEALEAAEEVLTNTNLTSIMKIYLVLHGIPPSEEEEDVVVDEDETLYGDGV